MGQRIRAFGTCGIANANDRSSRGAASGCSRLAKRAATIGTSIAFVFIEGPGFTGRNPAPAAARAAFATNDRRGRRPHRRGAQHYTAAATTAAIANDHGDATARRHD